MAFKAVDIVGISILMDYEAMFKEAGVDVQLAVNPCPLGATEDQVIAAIGEAEAVVTQTTFQPFSRRVLSSLSNCKLVASIGVGYDYLDVDAATEFSILATNVPDASIREVSDHAMALILACTRGIVRLNEVVKRGGWTSIACPEIGGEIWPKLSRLEGQTLGLIAFGRIARAVVPKAKGFGMRVIAYDPYASPESFKELGVESVELDQLLRESDAVSIHTPHTGETTGLIGRVELAKMKPNACLINTARGAVVDHEALYETLSQGGVYMAAFDTTEPEPIPADSPLLKLDNFIVTAHSAGLSPLAFAELQRRPALEVIRVAKGEWPAGLLNPEVKDKFRQRWGRSWGGA